MTTLRDVIKSQILDYAHGKGKMLTDDELRLAIVGVECCVSECMADSVKDAFSDIMYDRGHEYIDQYCQTCGSEVTNSDKLLEVDKYGEVIKCTNCEK
jgi:hypothetical protein